jgi:hypothetical protein
VLILIKQTRCAATFELAGNQSMYRAPQPAVSGLQRATQAAVVRAAGVDAEPRIDAYDHMFCLIELVPFAFRMQPV